MEFAARCPRSLFGAYGLSWPDSLLHEPAAIRSMDHAGRFDSRRFDLNGCSLGVLTTVRRDVRVVQRYQPNQLADEKAGNAYPSDS